MTAGLHYYALEPVLVKRIQAECPNVHTVLGLPDLFAIYENQQFANELNSKGRGGAAFVIFWDEQVAQARPDCDRANHTYIIAIVTKRHTKLRTGELARADNGFLVDEVLQVLRGWDYGPELGLASGIEQGRRRLKRVTSPVNRHQFPPDQNGLVVTFLAYSAENLLT